MYNYKMTAITLEGLETVTAEQLELIGAKNVQATRRAVLFEGDLKTLYLANVYCNTALRILKLIDEVKIYDEEDLYKKIYRIPWEDYFQSRYTLFIRSILINHNYRNSHYFTLKAKDAVVDRFRDKTGHRPDINKNKLQSVIHLFLNNDKLRVYIDASGESLHKRAYRIKSGPAALNEVMAAGIVAIAKPKEHEKVYAPMCGSGTLAIEAANYQLKKSPIGRRRFGFEFWNDFNERIWNEIDKNRLSIKGKDIMVMASDNVPKTVDIARENIESSGLSQFIDISNQDFFEMEGEENALILLNPPYGERMKEDDLFAFYEKIGDTLKHKWQGSRCAVISSNIEALHKIRLKPSKKVKVFNSQLPAELRIYEMFAGKRRDNTI